MRALHIMASGEHGGGATHLRGLLPALRSAGIEVHALVGDEGPLASWLREEHIATLARPLMGSRLDASLGASLWREAEAWGATLIHAHGTRAAALLSLGRPFALKRKHPEPRVIYHAHGLSCSQAQEGSLSWRLRLAGEALACHRKAAVLSCSAADLQMLERQRLIARGAGIFVPNAVPEASPRPTKLSASERRERRRKLGLPQEGLVVATVSRLVPQKDVATLASAVLPLGDVTLAVVGAGPLHDTLRNHALATSRRLRLLGARDDVPEVLALCDMFALSSRWEGEPIALLEAMAQGLPWVATHTAGAGQLGALGCGLLSPVGDVAALSRSLAQLIARPRWRAALGAAGARAAAERTVGQQAQHVAQIYRDTLAI